MTHFHCATPITRVQDGPARPVERILSRLQGVRETAPGRWIALCPAHNDRHPSLSVREASDGRVLLWCWAGCPTSQVLAALGLSWRDLFPDAPDSRRGRTRPLSRAEREAAKRAQAETELRRRLDVACEELHRRLCVYVRAIRLALDGADLETYERLAEWVHALPLLDHLLDALESPELDTRLWAAGEGETWLMT